MPVQYVWPSTSAVRRKKPLSGRHSTSLANLGIHWNPESGFKPEPCEVRWIRILESAKLLERLSLTGTMKIVFATILALASLGAQTRPLSFLNHNQPVFDAHNCYPYEGQWADRIDRALTTGFPVGIEQDLAWYVDPVTKKARVVVSHSAKTTGSEPELRQYFFERVRPIVEKALAENDQAKWPLIALHFDFKSNETPLLEAVWELLGEYEGWISTALKTANPNQLAPFQAKPILVMTEDSDAQQSIFFDRLPVGARLRLFGSAHTRPSEGKTSQERMRFAATAAPAQLLAERPTNYRRWWNSSWYPVEEGGQQAAGDWTAADNRRLRALVDHAHGLGFWIRFYTLDGFAPDQDRGWGNAYNFGTKEAAALRWKAAIAAGVNLIATDQYEELAAVMPSPSVFTANDPFLEKPYLQLGNAPKLADRESLMLLWHALDEAVDWKVEVKTSKDSQWKAAAKPAEQKVAAPGIPVHLVYRSRLTGLIPGEEFHYRVSRSGQMVFESTGKPRKAANQPVRFALFGDSAQGTPSQRAIAYQASLAKPDFVFITGDIVYGSGRISEYRAKFFPAYNADRASPETGAPLLRSIPFIAAPGNHDTAPLHFQRFPDALAYFLYWDQPMNGPAVPPRLAGNEAAQPDFAEGAKPRYPGMANFSFDYGNAHWTVLDSNPYMDWNEPALRAWLVKDLESARSATWRFVAFHHPGFNSSKSHFTDQWMRSLAPVFEAAKVDVVFSGHVHNYQRAFPLTFVPKPQPDGKPQGPKGEVAGDWALDRAFEDGAKQGPKGVIYIVSGAGGAGLYNTDQQADPSGWQAFTNKYIADRHSVTVVDIDGKTFRLRQISETGEEVDSFRISK